MSKFRIRQSSISIMEFSEWSKQNPDKSLNDYYAWKRKSGDKANNQQPRISNSYSSERSASKDYSHWVVLIVVAFILGVTNPNESKHEYEARKIFTNRAKEEVGDFGMFNGLKNGFLDVASTGLNSTNYMNYIICSTSTITVLGSQVGTTFGIGTMVWVYYY